MYSLYIRPHYGQAPNQIFLNTPNSNVPVNETLGQEEIISISPPPMVQAEKKTPISAIKKPVYDPSKPINPADYHLSPELIAPYVKNNMLMITWANHHYLDFAKNWVYHLRKVGVEELMVGAMDDDMLIELVKLGIPTWRMNTNITKHDLGWGSANFHSMGRAKIKLIENFLRLTGDLTVIISDIDTAWLRSPMDFFDKYPTADILTSTDELRPTVETEEMERFPESGSAFNIGIMLFRPKCLPFVVDWFKKLADPKMWDQTAFNNLARRGHTASDPKTHLFKGYDETLTIGILPASIFCSGHTFFVQHKYREFGLQPYVAHATFQYSGTVGKRNRFREALLWDDGPEYFDPPSGKGFLYFDISIPHELWEAAKLPVAGPFETADSWNHFSLVNYQLTHLRHALAIATLLNRIVVLPPIWCLLDKYWAPLNDGNIPGSKFLKPFICPADHVLDLEGGWAPMRGADDNPFGPHIEFREYSFMQNSRLPESVRKSQLTVILCGDGKASDDVDCSDGSAAGKIQILEDDTKSSETANASTASTDSNAATTSPNASITNTISQGAVVKIQPMLDSTALAKALEGSEKFKVLYFPVIADSFGGFVDPEKRRRFTHRVNHYSSVTCCLHRPDEPGWLWYDFFADTPDHKDRFGRTIPGPLHFEADSRVVFKGDSTTIKETIPNKNPTYLRKLTLPGLMGQEMWDMDQQERDVKKEAKQEGEMWKGLEMAVQKRGEKVAARLKELEEKGGIIGRAKARARQASNASKFPYES